MTKISINLLRWNTDLGSIEKVIDAVLASDYDDYLLVYSDNNGGPDGSTLIAQITEKYGNNPKVKIIDNKSNLGYAPGHNKFFAEADSELVMVLNPDAILHKDFLRNVVKVFDDPNVGGATGKMLKPNQNEKGEWIIDGTGIVIDRTRRARERGQLEVDHCQYDQKRDIFGVSGSAAVYRRKALEDARIENEFFDPDFFAYWEDLDLSWRMRLMGWNFKYVPEAVVYHERAVGVSKKGYRNIIEFIRHHAKFSKNVKRWNWRNHLFAIIKNDFGWSFWRDFPFIFAREFFMAIYITVFETSTWGALPDFFRLLPKMLRKRKIIQACRKITTRDMATWFNNEGAPRKQPSDGSLG